MFCAWRHCIHYHNTILEVSRMTCPVTKAYIFCMTWKIFYVVNIIFFTEFYSLQLLMGIMTIRQWKGKDTQLHVPGSDVDRSWKCRWWIQNQSWQLTNRLEDGLQIPTYGLKLRTAFVQARSEYKLNITIKNDSGIHTTCHKHNRLIKINTPIFPVQKVVSNKCPTLSITMAFVSYKPNCTDL